MKPPLRAVVVDDSAICREVLRELLEAEGDITVAGEAEDGSAAAALVQRERPDVVLLDVEMPRVGGLDAVASIMRASPVPILIVTGRAPSQHSSILFEALRRGALDVMGKPSMARGDEAAALRDAVRRVARIPVMRHMAPVQVAAAPPPPQRLREGASRVGIRILGVGASAGGPAAVSRLLGAFAAETAPCVVVAQHLLGGFASAYAEFLRHHVAMKVEVVERSAPVRPGVVYVAGEDAHIAAASPDRIVAQRASGEGGHRPSIDVLFRSLALHFGPSAAGVVLSGMGQDGAAGLLEMRRAGALTFAQDWTTAAVFGMPRAALEAGAAESVWALEALGPALLASFDKRLAR